MATRTKAPKAPAEESDVQAPTEPTTEDETVETPESEDDSSEDEPLDIVNGDLYVRQYSPALHGEDYAALAKQFVEKMNGRKGSTGKFAAVPASKINNLEVRYREKEDAELHIDKQKPDAPMVDKIKVFSDKVAAVAFGASKQNSSVVVSKRKVKPE